MKKVLLFLSISFITIGCNTNSSNKSASASSKTASNDPNVQEGLSLVAKSDCFSCHKIADKMVGPSYKSIAEKYTNTEGNRKSLAQKIINGGSGNWGSIPMNAHPSLSPGDAEKMVAYILSIQ